LAAAALTIGAGLLARSVLPVVSPVAFAAAVMVAFGLGLAFALPVLRRHRQQLAEGMPMLESIVASAGRGVAVAAMQAVALAGTGLALCVTGIGQLVAAGLLVVVAVAVAALLAGTALPALLALGEEWYVPDEGAAKARRPRMAGLLAAVGARPRIAVVVSLLLLAALAVPGFGAVLTPLGAGQATPGTTARDVFTEVARDFGPGYNAPLVVSMSLLGSDDPSGVLDSLRAQVQANPDVSRVVFASPNANIDTGVLFVIPATGPGDPATTALVWQLRTDAAAWLSDFGVSAAVSGQAARDVDVMDRLGTAAPWFALLLALIAAGVLLAATASLRYWLLASAGAALACAAAFGVSRLVWGELDALLAFLGGGLLFGLGIAHGVAVGAGRRSVPDAARLTAVGAVVVGVVFAFFVPAQPPPVQQLALFLSVGVLVDALLLRLILIPALARLLGDRLWRPTRIAGRVPSADLEGDALARRAEALASLPADNGIHVQGLTVRANGRELFAGLDLELSPGTVQVLEGDPAATRALLYGLGGRIAVEGSGMVAGYTINDERRDIRRVTKLLRADSPPPQFRRPATPVVLVDRADALSAEQGAALRWGLKANPKLTWVLGVQDPDFIQTLGIRAVPTRTALDQTGVTV
jgi:RND superfamily putative drug exporter